MSFSRLMRLLSCCRSCWVRGTGRSTPGNSCISAMINMDCDQYAPYLFQQQMKLIQILNIKVILPVHNVNFTIALSMYIYSIHNKQFSYSLVEHLSASFVTASCTASDLKDCQILLKVLLINRNYYTHHIHTGYMPIKGMAVGGSWYGL